MQIHVPTQQQQQQQQPPPALIHSLIFAWHQIFTVTMLEVIRGRPTFLELWSLELLWGPWQPDMEDTYEKYILYDIWSDCAISL